MKERTLLLLPVFFLYAMSSRAQEEARANAPAEAFTDGYTNEDDAVIDYSSGKSDAPGINVGIQALSMPFGNQWSFGAGLNGKVNFNRNQAVGLEMDYLGRSVNQDFGYIVGEPQLMHWNISAFYEHTVLTLGQLKANILLQAGVSGFNLKDNSIKEIYSWYDEYGIEHQGERAITIDKNIFFRFAPGIRLSYRLSPVVSLEAQSSYDIYWGHANFGRVSEFNNYIVGVGFSFHIKSD